MPSTTCWKCGSRFSGETSECPDCGAKTGLSTPDSRQLVPILAGVAVAGALAFALLTFWSADRGRLTDSEAGSLTDQRSTDLTARDFEVVSLNWRKDPSYGADGSVIYTVAVTNQSGQYIDHLPIRFTTYDSEGNVVTSSLNYVSGLAPGDTGATRGFATYFGEATDARVRIIP